MAGGFFLILAPVFAVGYLQNLRSLLLLLVVPLGLWITKKVYGNLEKRLWKSNHRSTYRLDTKQQISFTEWDLNTRISKAGNIPIDSIAYVVISYYALEDNIFYPMQTVTDFVPTKQMGKTLYVVYSEHGKKQMISIPFYPGQTQLDVWLETLQQNNIPSYETDLLLYLENESDRLELFEKEEDILVPYSGEKEKNT